MIRQFLKNKGYILTDGAMGTYYYEISDSRDTMSEWANINNPQLIKKIHTQYIEAGAKLLRTNTFSANTKVMDINRDELKNIIQQGYNICKEVANEKNVFVAADIGPIIDDDQNFDEVLDEYKFIVDCFIFSGANIFLFETFSSTKYLKEITEYIKSQNKDFFVIAQFAVDSTGHTRQGIPVSKIFEQAKEIQGIDAYGLNCGVGPTHMYTILKKLNNLGKGIITALPNAGYPYIENERTIYPGNPNYFAKVISDIKALGPAIVGGCCGTTPEHIKCINDILKKCERPKIEIKTSKEEPKKVKLKHENKILNKLKTDKVIMVELDPPYSSDIQKVLDSASILKESNVDIITIADSPLGKARAESTVVAAKIKREIGIDVMPHICCRDNNVIGLKSKLLGLHLEGIRQVLAVTGDPVPSANRGEIKGVFNINSIKLMELIKEMNEEVFIGDPLCYGGALNLNARNIDSQIRKVEQKLKAGAQYFLTQPIYDEIAIEKLIKIKEMFNIKVIAGIMPLVSIRNAMYLNNEVPGIIIPDKYVYNFKEDMSRNESEQVGIKIALDIINKITVADGLYIIAPFNRASMVSKIINKVGVYK